MNGFLIVARMHELEISPSALATQCGVSQGYMAQILRGYRPSKRTLKLLALALKCPVTSFTNEAGPPDRKIASG